MANLKSSKKDIRRTARRTAINNRNKINVDKAVKMVRKFVSTNSIEEARNHLSEAYKAIDKMVTRKLINKSKAARQKSRIAKTVSSEPKTKAKAKGK